ncbi:MAG: hypothetical protein QOG42_328 [Solirubrobacteraceae bacterium]|nr:hypothetical protein [Solirubrobacteraceae bacterium]
MLATLLLGMPALLLAAPAAHATVTVGNAQVTETNPPATATATFTVTRTGGVLTGPATIHFNTVDGSARAPDDYEPIAGDLHFGSLALGGTQVQTVPVTVRGDRLNEATETFRLVLSGSPEVAPGQGDGVGTILDDDPPPVVSVADAAATSEGGSATFTIALSAPSGRDVSVAFSTADGSAIAGEDYTARSGTLGIPAGATSATLGVALLDDAADEPDETFGLRIGSPVFATTGRASAAATIIDNDEPSAPPPPDGGPAAVPADAAAAGAGGAVVAPLAGAPGSAADGPAATTSAARLGLSSPRLRRPSIILVTVSCPRQATRCSGRVTIFSRANPRSKIKALRRERRLGQRNFKLAAGVTRTLTIALSRSDRVLLLRTGRMLVRAYAVTADAGGRSGVRRSTGTLIARTSHS